MKTFEMFNHTVEITEDYLDYLTDQLSDENRNDYGDITDDELSEVIDELRVRLA